MRSSAFVLALIIGAICVLDCHCKPRGGHRGKPGVPPFLKEVSAEARKEYYSILHSDKKISEQKQEIDAWAKKNNVEKQVQEFHAKLSEFFAKLKENITALVEQLPSKYKELSSIFENEEQTRKEMFEAVKAFRKDSEEAFLVLDLVAKIFMHRNYSALEGLEKGEDVQQDIPEKLDHEAFIEILGYFPGPQGGQYLYRR